MPRLELAREIFDDFDRILAHLARFEVQNAATRIDEIIDALQILTHSPEIGRPARAGNRELVIGWASRGYVALYRYIPNIDTVFILAIRGHRVDEALAADPDRTTPPTEIFAAICDELAIEIDFSILPSEYIDFLAELPNPDANDTQIPDPCATSPP